MSELKSRADAVERNAVPMMQSAPGAGQAGVSTMFAAKDAVRATPDVADSGVEADLKAPVHVAWSRVMQDVEWISKGRQTTSGAKYAYRGIDDVMNYVGPALRKHGVFVMPAGIEPTFEVIKTSSGSAMNYCRATVHFTIYGPNGDTMPASVLGEGFDSGDKSGSKAQSVALRTLYLNGLAIQTNEPARDTEYGVQHEIAGPPVRTAESYMEEILSDSTSINRLQQIKAELYGNRTLGSAEVELIDGERISLAALVRRIGMARVGKAEQ